MDRKSQSQTKTLPSVGLHALVSRWEYDPPVYSMDERACTGTIRGLNAEGKIVHLFFLSAYPSEWEQNSARALVEAANAAGEPQTPARKN